MLKVMVDDDRWAAAGVPHLGRWIVTLIAGGLSIPTLLGGWIGSEGPVGQTQTAAVVIVAGAVTVGIALVAHGWPRERAADITAFVLAILVMAGLGLVIGQILVPLETAPPSASGRPLLLLAATVVLNIPAAIAGVLVGMRAAELLRRRAS
jgi:hypothetical protein